MKRKNEVFLYPEYEDDKLDLTGTKYLTHIGLLKNNLPVH